MQKSLTNLQGWNHTVKMDIRDRTLRSVVAI